MANTRYNSVAISLHWLIAALLIGLVVLGKVMTSLEAEDPFRFELIQWHKSFGILVLWLIVLRLLWRLTHRPPRLPSHFKSIEKIAAGGAHLVLYLLMFAIPLSGWFMVSASPLNLQTELFGAIPWPHVPWFENVPDKPAMTEQLLNIHHWLAQGLLVVVILHVAAALRHKFVLKDQVMSRVFLSASEHGADKNHGIVPGLLLVLAGGLYLVNTVDLHSRTSANRSVTAEVNGDAAEAVVVNDSVGFTALQMGEPVVGVFDDIDLQLVLDTLNVSEATLNATLQTASVNTGDGQIDSTVVTEDWFASEQFPAATFVSTAIAPTEIDVNKYDVAGELMIRGVAQPVTFVMSLVDGVASGELLIDRTLYGVGVGGQDNFIDPEVTIRFQVSNQVR